MFSKKSDASGSLGRNSRSVIWETCSCKRPACRLRLAEAQMFSRSRPSQRCTRCHQYISDTGSVQKVKGIKPTVYFQSICNHIQVIWCVLLDIENLHESLGKASIWLPWKLNMDKSEFWNQARPGFLPFQSDRITGSKKHKFICNLTNHKRTTREIVKSKKGVKKGWN